jgi:glycosyltransferase involved in cell wall biosynthesis
MRDVVSGINVKLLVVGEFYEDEREYQKQIDRLNLGKNVVVVDTYVPNDLVAQYFCASDVVVLPYIDATQSGIVQIAYNFNKPVITTDVGGLAEVVIDGRTGIVVQSNSSKELARAILKFFSERLGDKLADGVAEQKKLYSWDNLVKAIEELAGPSLRDGSRQV